MKSIDDIDQDVFFDRASGHFQGLTENWNNEYDGRVLSDPTWKRVLTVEVKTGRTPLDGNDCDALGVESPSNDLDAAAGALADEFGLRYVGFEPCEKGWGWLKFAGENKETKVSDLIDQDYSPSLNLIHLENVFEGYRAYVAKNFDNPHSPGSARALSWSQGQALAAEDKSNN